MGDPVVHFELNGPDGEALATFYSSLFGWGTSKVEGFDYWLIDTRSGQGINGGIGQTEDGGAFATFYVQSDQPEALMEKAEKAGATVITPITETPMVTFGLFSDTDGLVVGIVKGGTGQEGTAPSAGDNPPVDWFDVLGTDAQRTQGFYRDLFGWETDDSGFPGYALVQHEHDEQGRGIQIGGGLGAGDGTTWATVYANVPDVEATLQKAESLGGKRAYGPNEIEGQNMKTGAFHDPAGNPFGLYSSSR